MLLMLNQIGDSCEIGGVDLTFLTLLTFPLPEAFSRWGNSDVNNVNNVKSYLGEKRFWQGKMLIMLIMLKI